MAVKVPKGKPPAGDINVTPLIDVVLVLLIIFMVLTPIIINEMAVNLPEKTETVEQDDLPKDQLVVAVCEDGSVALNKRVMTDAELADQVGRRLRSKGSRVVFVDAHPDAPYDRVVSLMDSVRTAGADKLGMASLKTADEFRGCTPTAEAPAEAGAEGAAPQAGG